MASAPRRERKVVSVVFCDLVGSTPRAEQLDPEDVEAFLEPYHRQLRSELEHFGGTVEKFIGDAVMALFAAPLAHEDDPERAVRAALAIRDWALENEIEVRLAVTTGEALVRLDARPEAGEGMASGDVVNTAARLQAAAPVNGTLVDETTYRATRHAIEHDEAEPVEAKGKSQALAVWQPRRARSRFGVDIAHEARVELVGRERELGVLRDAFDRAVHGRTPQLLTLVGVPGIGKSRLVYELSRIADALPEIITWRQGRCLAYGEGVTLWALGEIVKAQAGILEQDNPDAIGEKIRRSVDAALPGNDDAAWVTTHLLTLLGLGSEAELGGDRRNESFAAWRRYPEGLAELRPSVLVFEDLHWADEILLDFVDELVEWIADVPLLVVATARPELLDRRPGWGGGKVNATTLGLAPLADEETAQLIARLIARPVLAAESQQSLLECAGGNPLYAEQFADLYLERGSADELPVPETLHGLIAARLDALSETEKRLMQDASVVGKVFWASALQHSDASTVLHALERKGFVRRQRRSSVEGESEYAFAHALVRDVAYGQIARAERAQRHRYVAEWIEGLGRPEDHAEMLAYHWGSALEVARAVGTNGADLVDHARFALRDGGDRAFGLNAFRSAASYYESALELWPVEDEERPALLFRHAHALQIADDDRAGTVLADAAGALLEAGEVEAAAEAKSLHAQFLWYRGQRDPAYERQERAVQLLDGRSASRAKARTLCQSARFKMLAGDGDEALRLAQAALALTEELGLDELRAHALATIGSSKELLLGTPGFEELEQALEIALAVRSPIASTIVNNLAVAKFRSGLIAEATELYHEAARLAEQLGDGSGLRWSRGNLLFSYFFLGDWQQAEREADAFIVECETSPHYLEGNAREIRGNVRLGRGDIAGALEDWTRSLELAREAKDPQAVVPSLLTYAHGLTVLGRLEEARALADEALGIVEQQQKMSGVLGIVVGIAEELGIRERMLELLARDAAHVTPWREATLAAISGDYQHGADLYSAIGSRTQAADLQLEAARAFMREGRQREAEIELQKALAFYRSVGASFYVQQAEELLPRSA